MKEEFLEKITLYEPILLKICRMYCRTVEDEQDLYQDIVLQLWKSYDRFRNESKLSTWLYRIALNTAITRIRKDKRSVQGSSVPNDRMHQIPNQITDEKEEQFAAMMRAISILSSIDKAIMMLYLEEHSYQEIGVVMGISESNVGFKIHQIKDKLRRIIKENSYGDR